MEKDRNIKYLNDRRIIYNRLPISDIPTETHSWGCYYEYGTHECYQLFRTDAKINSLRSLKWHLLVLKHLNDSLDDSKLEEMFRYICNVKNGFVSINFPDDKLNQIINSVIKHKEHYIPNNKVRKLIFNPFCGLTKKHKQRLIGKYSGKVKSIKGQDMYECMLHINNDRKKITTKELAVMMGCSVKTISRHTDENLREEKEMLNNSLL